LNEIVFIAGIHKLYKQIIAALPEMQGCEPVIMKKGKPVMAVLKKLRSLLIYITNLHFI